MERDATPDFSIILPARNEPEIADLLEDISAMIADTRYEIVVIDDSLDGATAAAVRRFAQRNPAARVIHGPRRGPLAAILAGASQSRGSYLLYLDGGNRQLVALLPSLIAKARAGYDVVLPSRRGSSDGGMFDGTLRSRLSWSLRLLPRILFPGRLGPAIDTLGGFFGIRRAAFDRAGMRSHGWTLGLNSFLLARIVG